jgi:hypothetical protein
MSVLRTNVSGCSPFYGGRNMSGEANPGGTWCLIEWGWLSRCMYWNINLNGFRPCFWNRCEAIAGQKNPNADKKMSKQFTPSYFNWNGPTCNNFTTRAQSVTDARNLRYALPNGYIKKVFHMD